jgi:hypothetical protein
MAVVPCGVEGKASTEAFPREADEPGHARADGEGLAMEAFSRGVDDEGRPAWTVKGLATEALAFGGDEPDARRGRWGG